MATLKINAIRANLAHSAHKILGAVFVVICLAISATYADDNTSKSTQTTKAKSAQNGGGGTPNPNPKNPSTLI